MPVYMIRAGEGGPVKIIALSSQHGEDFLATLQKYHFEELCVVRVIHGMKTKEQEIHSNLSTAHIKRGWFRWSDEMLTADFSPPPRERLSTMKPETASLRKKQNERNQKIISRVIDDDVPASHIAREFGISQQRVSQIIKNAHRSHLTP